MKKDNTTITKNKLGDYLKRRPHRSFLRTRRRDYTRSLVMPGYFAFTGQVISMIRKNHKLFWSLLATYSLAILFVVGISSQEAYETLVETLSSTSGDMFSDFYGRIGSASLLFAASVSGGYLQSLTEVQQVYVTFITLITALTTVWLLRNIMAGHKINLRDGLYNAGSPIVSILAIIFLVLIQLIPLALAIVGYSAAEYTGLINGGIEAMLFWIFAGLLSSLSLYWVTSSFFAIIIATLPGMYPYKAIKIAGDLVIGRRLRILMRLIWMVICIAILWIVTMIPTIMFDSWIKEILKSISWIPTVPILLLVLNGITVLWMSTYVYLLYRRVVDDESKPAI